MIDISALKDRIPWRLLRVHVCTLAVALSVNSTMRIPRDSFRYGGLPYLIIFTFFSIVVAWPVTLLQLSIGQLSQQDAVGVWKAVPLFKGIGYLKLMTSFIGSIYTTICAAVAASYFIYTLRSSIPFWECRELHMTTDGYENYSNTSGCLNETFMAPVKENPVYYAVVGVVVLILWGASPLLLYSPVRSMKRIFYIAGPSVLLLAIIILSATSDIRNLIQLNNSEDWTNFMKPYIWYSALIQTLISTQVGNGFLISTADTIYSSTNVQCTTNIFVFMNVLSGMAGILFWHGIDDSIDKDTSIFAVMVAAYQAAESKELNDVWPLLMFTMIFLSTIISMVIFLYPIYDRLQRISDDRWRRVTIAVSVMGAAAALTMLAGRQSAIEIAEDIVIPIFITGSVVIEVTAFTFIYGWKALRQDIEFLSGDYIGMIWITAWCCAPFIILPFLIWWTLTITLSPLDWKPESWKLWIVIAIGLVIIVVTVFAILSIIKQVQYDLLSKIQSAFKPSRHWGPRDPITHYYWRARREELNRSIIHTEHSTRSTYSAWQLPQFSAPPNVINIPTMNDKVELNNWPGVKPDIKRRAYSDDWLYTRFRKKSQGNIVYCDSDRRQRSRSLEWFSVLLPTIKQEEKLKEISDNTQLNSNKQFNTVEKTSETSRSTSCNNIIFNSSTSTSVPSNDETNINNKLSYLTHNKDKEEEVEFTELPKSKILIKPYEAITFL